MLGDRREAHVEVLGNVAGGELVGPDKSEDRAPPGLGDDLEGVHQHYI